MSRLPSLRHRHQHLQHCLRGSGPGRPEGAAGGLAGQYGLLALSVYTLRSGEPEELVQGTSYVKYAVNDLNQDGLWELVVLRADEEGNGIADTTAGRRKSSSCEPPHGSPAPWRS